MTEYSVVLQETANGFSAFVPELPGCVATAESREQTVALLEEAVELHLDLLGAPYNMRFEPAGIAYSGRNTAFAFVYGKREFREFWAQKGELALR